MQEYYTGGRRFLPALLLSELVPDGIFVGPELQRGLEFPGIWWMELELRRRGHVVKIDFMRSIDVLSWAGI
jgi:hypothetical protein